MKVKKKFFPMNKVSSHSNILEKNTRPVLGSNPEPSVVQSNVPPSELPRHVFSIYDVVRLLQYLELISKLY